MRPQFTFICVKVTWRLWALGYFPYRRRVGYFVRPIYSFALGPLRFHFMDTRASRSQFDARIVP